MLQFFVGDMPLPLVSTAFNGWASRNGYLTRTMAALKHAIQRHLGLSTRSVGEWVPVADVAKMLGFGTKRVTNWDRRHKAITICRPTRITTRLQFTYYRRTDLLRMAKVRPDLFGGANRDGLFQLLGDEQMVDNILAAYPQAVIRPPKAAADVPVALRPRRRRTSLAA